FLYCRVFLLYLRSFPTRRSSDLCGVALFVWSGMIYDSYQALLEEGEYSREKKLQKKKNSPLSGIYWCLVTALYLGTSFISGKWRSEEHTSELQSRFDLVCRLLLE